MTANDSPLTGEDFNNIRSIIDVTRCMEFSYWYEDDTFLHKYRKEGKEYEMVQKILHLKFEFLKKKSTIVDCIRSYIPLEGNANLGTPIVYVWLVGDDKYHGAALKDVLEPLVDTLTITMTAHGMLLEM